MRYTVILTETTDGGIHATVPTLPGCAIDAKSRDEALTQVRQTIDSIISRSEVVQVDIPAEPKSGSLQVDTPWEWFGAFKDDATWKELFNEIENQRTG